MSAEPGDAVGPDVEPQVGRVLVLDVLAQDEAQVVAVHARPCRIARTWRFALRSLRCMGARCPTP